MKNNSKKLIAILFAIHTGFAVAGEGILPVPDYSGNLLERSTLTGDWKGVRQNLAEKGLQVDLKVVTTYLNMFSGGIKKNDNAVSTQSLLLQFDTGKADLWPGGLLKLRVESRLGETIERTGAFSPVYANALFPNDVNHVNEDSIGLTELVYTQFLLPQFGVFGGLINTTEGDANELAGSLSSTAHFMNSSFLFSLGEIRTVPSVSLGGGVIFIPADWLTGTVAFLDTQESATKNPFDTNKGTTVSTEWKAKYDLGGLPGAQTFGFLYAFDNEFRTSDQDPRGSFPQGIIIGRTPVTANDSWAFYHNAHQYLQWEDGKGWGVFTRFGFADKKTNPIDWSFAAGISGNGLMSARPNDAFGIGYYHLGLINTPLFTALDLNDENGLEVWYNAELTPWFHVTADFQYIDSAFGKPKFSRLPPGIVAAVAGKVPEGDSAWIFGLRTEIKF